MFGLAFTLTFCCLFTAVDIILLRFLIFLTRFRKALAPRIDAWIQVGTYQLQRRAYDAHGEGDWQRLEEEIPLTKGDEELGELPVESLPAGFPLNTIYHKCTCQTTISQTDTTLTTPLTEKILEIPESPGQVSALGIQIADQNPEMQGTSGQNISSSSQSVYQTELSVSPILITGGGPPEPTQLDMGPQHSFPSMFNR